MSFEMEMEDYREDLKLKKYKKCLVTGGAGFIGSNLVDELIKDGHEVIVIDDLSTGNKENINPKAKFYHRSISLMSEFSMFEDVDVVFHTAAKARVQPSIDNPIDFNNINVSGTLNILQACVDYGVNRFVYSSSSSVYGDVKQLPTTEEHSTNPMSPYALQKLIGEQYCKFFYMHPIWGDVFNIGNGDNRSVNQIADLIGGDRVNVNPVIEPKETLADNNKFKKTFNWKPTMKIEDWITKYKEDMGL